MATRVDHYIFVKHRIDYCASTIFTALFLLLFIPSSTFPTEQPDHRRTATASKVIYVVSHGWHTGIVLKTTEIPEAIVWPEIRDFAGNQYIEVGWGDRDYYQAPETTWATALKAALWSTGSVLHIAGFNEPVRKFFSASDVVEVPITDEGLKQLSGFIARTHLRGEGESMKLKSGLYGNSRFYPAKGKFYVFYNCNTWVAEALSAGGLPMKHSTLTADSVMTQVRTSFEGATDHSRGQ